jgi:hypothetical protein
MKQCRAINRHRKYGSGPCGSVRLPPSRKASADHAVAKAPLGAPPQNRKEICFSKGKAKPALHFSGIPRAEDPPEVGVSKDAIRQIEIRTIEQVENFPSELELRDAKRPRLASAKSILAKPGPTTLLRRALPNVYRAGRAKADVSNHWSGVRSPPGRFGFRNWSGRCAGPVPMLARSTLRFTVNGAPAWATQIALARQPPRTASAAPPASAKNGN